MSEHLQKYSKSEIVCNNTGYVYTVKNDANYMKYTHANEEKRKKNIWMNTTKIYIQMEKKYPRNELELLKRTKKDAKTK